MTTQLAKIAAATALGAALVLPAAQAQAADRRTEHALIGGAVGALAGGLIGGDATGALVGAGAGALLGAVTTRDHHAYRGGYGYRDAGYRGGYGRGWGEDRGYRGYRASYDDRGYGDRGYGDRGYAPSYDRGYGYGRGW